MLRKSGLRHLCLLLATWLLGGLLGATLVRIAPGFESDGRELDGRYSEESLRAFRDERSGEKDVIAGYWRHLSGLARGDFGFSRTFGTPVRQLLAERFPVTARLAVSGLAAGWIAALALALPGVMARKRYYELGTTVVASSFLSVPTALVALVFLNLDWPAWAALAVVVFPRVFRYTRNILGTRAGMEPVMNARAFGMSERRILMKYVVLPAAPELLAVVGISASLAFSAAIPVEALCDVPGVGALAWQAALSRDFPLLVNVTMLVALIVLAANASTEFLTSAMRRDQV